MDFLLACDGCFKGFPAVASLIIIVLALIGTIYMLLASNYGLREGYLILMVGFFGWMIIMSAIWLFGAPGTTTATGPRGREPKWIPFTATSPVGQEDFKAEVDSFPSGWDPIGKDYPGGIASQGEFETIHTEVIAAEARLAQKQGTEAVKPADWTFRVPGSEALPGQEDVPEAKQLGFKQKGNTLLFGAVIPATDKHPEVKVFAYRDKGLVFLQAFIFLVVSVLGFILHLWLLSRLERRREADAARLEPAAA